MHARFTRHHNIISTDIISEPESAGNYSDIEIDGVLSPNDGIARAIITSCENAGQPIPVVSDLDAENESVEWVWSGRQYSTVAKEVFADDPDRMALLTD